MESGGPYVVRRRVPSVASAIRVDVAALREHLKALERLGWVESAQDAEGRDLIRVFQLRHEREEAARG